MGIIIGDHRPAGTLFGQFVDGLHARGDCGLVGSSIPRRILFSAPKSAPRCIVGDIRSAINPAQAPATPHRVAPAPGSARPAPATGTSERPYRSVSSDINSRLGHKGQPLLVSVRPVINSRSMDEL